MNEVEKTVDSPAADVPMDSHEDVGGAADAADQGASQTFDALAPEAATGTATQQPIIDQLSVLTDFYTGTVYSVGTGFVLGVLFMAFVLLVLDFMRRKRNDGDGGGKKSS